MAFWVYILRCSDDSYYTGHTDDLERRVAEHHAGTFKGYTQTRRPLTLVWSQEMTSRAEALDAERIIKPWSRKKKEGLINRDWYQVSFYARPPRERASTSLSTNDVDISAAAGSLVPSEVEAPRPA